MNVSRDTSAAGVATHTDDLGLVMRFCLQLLLKRGATAPSFLNMEINGAMWTLVSSSSHNSSCSFQGISRVKSQLLYCLLAFVGGMVESTSC